MAKLLHTTAYLRRAMACFGVLQRTTECYGVPTGNLSDFSNPGVYHDFDKKNFNGNLIGWNRSKCLSQLKI